MRKSVDSKLYYSISEVAEITDLQPYTLRTWEKEFPCLRPRRSRGKNRAYRERDIGIILLLKRLLYQERYTTQGARQKLRNEPELVAQAANDASGVRGLLELHGGADERTPADVGRLGASSAGSIAAVDRPGREPAVPPGVESAVHPTVACVQPTQEVPLSAATFRVDPPEMRELLARAREELRQVLRLLEA